MKGNPFCIFFFFPAAEGAENWSTASWLMILMLIFYETPLLFRMRFLCSGLLHLCVVVAVVQSDNTLLLNIIVSSGRLVLSSTNV